jgi:hypothetical protein
MQFPAPAADGFRLRSVVRPPRATLTVGLSYQGSIVGRFGGATKSTLATIIGDPLLLRFVFSNGPGDPWNVKAYWAPTAQVGNGWSPYRADGRPDPGLFAPVTFNGGGADLPPDATPGGDAVVGTIAPNMPAYFSDWMAATGLLARTDATDAMKLVLVRTQSVGGPSFGYGTTAGLHPESAHVGGASAHFSSDRGIDELADTGFVPNPYSHLVAVQIHSRTPGYSVLYAGSSILAGTTTEPLGRQGFPRIACRTMTLGGIPFAALRANVDGIPNTPVVAASALAKIGAYRPDFVLIQVANRNDRIDAATQDVVWRHAMEMAEATQGAGGMPILVTATPWPVDAAKDAIRHINNDRARASGLTLFDYDALLTDGASPARLQPRFNDSGDQTHPGITGHIYAAEQLATLFTALVTPRLRQDTDVLRRAAEAARPSRRTRGPAVLAVFAAAAVAVVAAGLWFVFGR